MSNRTNRIIIVFENEVRSNASSAKAICLVDGGIVGSNYCHAESNGICWHLGFTGSGCFFRISLARRCIRFLHGVLDIFQALRLPELSFRLVWKDRAADL